MNIKKTKDFVASLVGKPCLFKVNVGRNKWEKLILKINKKGLEL